MATRRSPMQKTVEMILEKYGLLDEFWQAVEQRDEFHLRLENKGYMPLVIEVTWQGEISVAHYYTQNGDAIADPELVFEPAAWRVVEITQPPILINGRTVGGYQRAPKGKYFPQATQLANMMAKNIRHQGFIGDGVTVESLTHPITAAKEPQPRSV